MTNTNIPSGLWPYFQEFDPQRLDREADADLIIQRTLEYGTWEEIRWLIEFYSVERVRKFLRRHGERLLSAPSFTLGAYRKQTDCSPPLALSTSYAARSPSRKLRASGKVFF